MTYKAVQTGSFIVIFLTDENLLISVGINPTIYLSPEKKIPCVVTRDVRPSVCPSRKKNIDNSSEH